MLGLKVDQAKGFFFDAPKVIRAVDRTTRQVLSKFGAFVRTAARSSIRKRKRASAPGQPPSSHTGLLKRFIYFGYDPHQQSVVIGPTKINAQGQDIPHVLEYGGPSAVVRRRRGKRTSRTVTVAARPFMHPALEKELPKMPAMWRDSVKP